MEIYNKKFVYFDWDDKLEGKKVMVSDDIYKLKRYVNGEEIDTYEISKSNDDKYPFRVSGTAFRFCYYDPYYEIKRAYDAGMTIQYKYEGMTWNNWVRDDMPPDDYFEEWEWRIKPDDIIWKVILSDDGGVLGIAKTTDKHIYFEGTAEECGEWIDKHKHLADLMKSWENGKAIQYCNNQYDEERWVTCVNDPLWEPGTVYRIKPEDTYVPFDNLNEFISKWESMNPGCIVRPKCTMPMIWVKSKETGNIYLIGGYDFENNGVGIYEYWFTLENMFKDYTFLNDSIIGKVKE